MKRNLIAALALSLFASHASAVLVCTSADPHYDDTDDGPFTDVAITYAYWHVGDASGPDLNIGPEQDVACAANGAELAALVVKFPNLPQRKNSALTIWRGDNARFILDNL